MYGCHLHTLSTQLQLPTVHAQITTDTHSTHYTSHQTHSYTTIATHITPDTLSTQPQLHITPDKFSTQPITPTHHTQIPKAISPSNKCNCGMGLSNTSSVLTWFWFGAVHRLEEGASWRKLLDTAHNWNSSYNRFNVSDLVRRSPHKYK